MRVLLAVDGSDDARKATAWLRELPLPTGTTIRVLAVANVPHAMIDIAPVHEFQESVREVYRREAEAARAMLAARATTEVHVIDGDPRDVIVREACGWPADLVVVGARGFGALGRFLMGSVSMAVLHGAPGAVAVVRGEPRRPRRLLVACDGSPDALTAVRFLARLPFGRDASARLLGVATPPPTPPTAPEVVMPWPLPAGQFVAEQKGYLEGALGRAAIALKETIGSVERSVIGGHPAAEIVAASDEPGVDLVVVGARGLGLFGRFLLGSVSDRVAQHASCPVLVVKAKG